MTVAVYAVNRLKVTSLVVVVIVVVVMMMVMCRLRLLVVALVCPMTAVVPVNSLSLSLFVRLSSYLCF